ncbi:MAG TPA: AAA family ATPase, partial [Terriglobia bacterium]|nr:AAA family ATPase [Terriglobia bacterium]
MSFSDLLTPRKEVLSEQGIEGIIDLDNALTPRKGKVEADPRRFFALTYPTADIRRVLREFHNRFNTMRASPGLYLFEGLKGCGKSHLLLLLYHLFKSSEEGRAWLGRHQIECSLPQGITVIVNKFTDMPLVSIWEYILRELKIPCAEAQPIQPGKREMESALSGRRVVIIFDELEQGIRCLQEPYRSQNIAFLQMLSEWANQTRDVTLCVALYGETEEPGATLKRVPCCRVQFRETGDRAKVVLHRLFENHDSLRTDSAAAVVDSYLNAWQRHTRIAQPDYRSQFLTSYPFTPELMELLLERVPARGGFQNVRGALGFLGNLVRQTHQRADVIAPGQASLADREVMERLHDLDVSGDLLRKAQNNYEDLKGQPLADEIAAAVLLYTVTSPRGTRTSGCTRDELMRSVLRPDSDVNTFEQTLTAFTRFAANFHSTEGRYYFDTEDQPEAKVEFRALRVDDAEARAFLRQLFLQEILREPSAVFFEDSATTQEALNALPKDRIRFVLGPRRLKPEDRHALFHGLEVRNQVLLLEPRDPDFDLDRHPDLLHWAKRQIAAEALLASIEQAELRETYERIKRADRKYSVDAIRRAGLVYIAWQRYGATAQEDMVEEEEITSRELTAHEVIQALHTRLFPVQRIVEHLSSRLSGLLGKSVRAIEREYKSTLTFPVPLYESTIPKAIRQLAGDGVLSVQHPRGNYCDQDPDLSDTELLEATLSAPFEKPPLPRPPLGPSGEGLGPPVPDSATSAATAPAGPPAEPPAAIAAVEEVKCPPKLSPGELR